MSIETVLSFTRKYHRILTIAGAGIVLLTFFVREDLREQAKDSLERFERARTKYQMDRRLEDLKHSILSVPNLVALNLASATTKEAPLSQTQLRTLIEGSLMREEYQSGVDDASDLARELPSSGQAVQLERQARSDLDNLEDSEKAFRKTFSRDAGLKPPNESQRHAAAALQPLSFSAYVSTGNYIRYTLRLAREEGELREKRFNAFRKVSYVLFVFGWSIGLAGKLSEPESEIEEDEL